MNPLRFILNDRVYETLKWVIVAVLPAVGLLYGALSEVWGWPNAAAVLTTIAAVTTFLGAIFGISTVNFNRAHDVTVTEVDPE